MTGAKRAMTAAERDAFLAEPLTAILSVQAEPGRAPLAVPMWYGYQPGGDLTLITPAASRKATLLRAAGRAAVVVQRTESPRKYVYVEGPVVEIREPATADDRRALARRYLGPDGGDEFVRTSAEVTASMAVVRIRPERWLSETPSERE
jgi:nitroimidazol reductase NimA-like FMN-containing flavoprotein (pyridoxamine 5'-phosphate oxidase superfamily)